MRGMGGYFNDNNRFMPLPMPITPATVVSEAVVLAEVSGGANGLNASKMIAANYNY